MKILYKAENDGCLGEVNEVVLFPNELLEGKSDEEVKTIIKDKVYHFGCSGCTDYEQVNDETQHQWVCVYDNKLKYYDLQKVNQKDSLS